MDRSAWAAPEGAALALLAWFDRHQRDLPWRRTRDPYAIWVSEIMLQQTRVAAVLDHYARWMARFPTIPSLAAASLADVLALWSGLGYYRRARFLHAGAQAVVAEHGGQLPRTAIGLRAIPGIGEYTSAAIASIAFGEPVAVVDGNVERVVLRLAGLGQPAGAPDLAATAAKTARAVRRIANSLLLPERPGAFNQAMMELGATVCLPRGPLCLACPVQQWCHTRGEHRTTPRAPMHTRSVAYSLLERQNGAGQELLLVRRAADASLMAGMWELPPHSAGSDQNPPAPLLLTLRHAITNTNYQVSVFAGRDAAGGDAADASAAIHPARNQAPDGAWFPVYQLPQLPLTGLARKVLRRLGHWPAPSQAE
ncbi:MAG TPA: A/G-specific adenine glycosylase [Acidobacteriaceae bacterium]